MKKQHICHVRIAHSWGQPLLLPLPHLFFFFLVCPCTHQTHCFRDSDIVRSPLKDVPQVHQVGQTGSTLFFFPEYVLGLLHGKGSTSRLELRRDTFLSRGELGCGCFPRRQPATCKQLIMFGGISRTFDPRRCLFTFLGGRVPLLK